METQLLKEMFENLSSEISDIKETQTKHFDISQETKIQTTKTNGRVNAHDDVLKDIKIILEKHDKKIDTIWDWRMLVLGGCIIVVGLLSYLVPVSISFFRTVNNLENNIRLSKDEIATDVVERLETKYNIKVQ